MKTPSDFNSMRWYEKLIVFIMIATGIPQLIVLMQFSIDFIKGLFDKPVVAHISDEDLKENKHSKKSKNNIHSL